jgi:hypothetical protein
MADEGNLESVVDSEKLGLSIAHDYFVRVHMFVILSAVIASGVLASKCLLMMHVTLNIRYPIAVAVSYAVFLLLIRVWIWYVSVRSHSRFRDGRIRERSSWFTFGGGSGGGSGSIGGGSGGGFSGFGGGDSGGGGASSDWQANEVAAFAAQPVPAPSGGGGGGGSFLSGMDLGGSGDNNGMIVIVLLVALVACIMGGGVYLIVVAPHILPEAACQVLLAGGLSRVSKEQHHNWMRGVIWSTWIPFVIVLVAAGALGHYAHRYCPAAPRLIDVLHCSARQ